MRNPYYFEAILDYAEKMTTEASALLEQLERETHLKMLSPQMISGFHLGRFLSIIAQIKKPKCIYEFGTFTGYASFCLLEGLAEGGIIHTFEVNPETKWLFEKYRSLFDAEEKIIQHFGDAYKKIDLIDQDPDLVWIDAGKKDNLKLFNAVVPRMKKGSIIMVDNTLWSGKVLEDDPDKHTRVIHNFNKRAANSPLVQTLFVPIRDGVIISIVQ